MIGKFIALEGPDGSGKSTIANMLEKYFIENNIDYILTREPGGTKIGEDIRNIILDTENKDMSNATEALLYAASRAQHVNEKIKPELKKGNLVLTDRFVISSLAYQGVGRDLGIEEVKKINDFAIDGMYPDLVLFFHVDPEETLKRKMGEKADRLELEGNNFHRKVYKGYMSILETYEGNLKVIDANQSIEEVFNDALEEIEKLIKSKEG